MTGRDTDDRLRRAWRDTPAPAVPGDWQAGVMAAVREQPRAGGLTDTHVLLWGSLAAAALVLLALGAALASGVDPRADLLELATRAPSAASSLLRPL